MFLDFLLNFVFPKRCFGCGKEGTYLCTDCLKNTDKTAYSICPVCLQKAIDGRTHPACRTKNKPNGLVSFYRYRRRTKRLIKELKYRFCYALEPAIRRMIICGLQDCLSGNGSFRFFLKSSPLVIPIPLFWRKKNWRGFNQSEIMARSLAAELKLKLALNLLLRTKNTLSQAELTKKERIKNVKSAFQINPDFNRHSYAVSQSALVVDDVWTTGSTLNAAAGVLKKAGFKEVWGWTLAR